MFWLESVQTLWQSIPYGRARVSQGGRRLTFAERYRYGVNTEWGVGDQRRPQGLTLVRIPHWGGRRPKSVDHAEILRREFNGRN